MSAKYRIAVIADDGIGQEVMPEGIRVLEAAGRRFGILFQWEELDWSCERYQRVGKMMPDDGLDRIKSHDSIFLGAVGYPGVADHVSLWGLLIPPFGAASTNMPMFGRSRSCPAWPVRWRTASLPTSTC
jgi:tartrate dehydrogenase/decarboxylase/D-malate dehydrogenase